MKKILAEFKEFISRGNVVDLAVGMIIGSSFTAIVNSLVNDMIMPLVGWMFGGIDFTSLRFVIREATDTVEEAAINYGSFLQSIVNFLLISIVIFLMVKAINSFHRKKKVLEEPLPEEPEEPPPADPEDVVLLREIRDLLKDREIRDLLEDK